MNIEDKLPKAEDVFYQTLVELGFDKCQPHQLTNSDHWLVTTHAMHEYAKRLLDVVAESAKATYSKTSWDDSGITAYVDKQSILRFKDLLK